ncbi:DUF2180 family protein [Streptomyces mesophilus]|uniref:DUF2180 family protein n=1 Tax=Streptomyces mesophilus TaxID=1775132 RepID=UPI0033238FC9
MKCYDCAQAGEAVDAVIVCRHCGCAVCTGHAHVTTEETHRVVGTGVSYGPHKARHATCTVCHRGEMFEPSMAGRRSA